MQFELDCYRVQIHWTWSSHGFREVYETYTNDVSKEALYALVLDRAKKIAVQYCFDCGDLEHPLNPRILGVTVTPMAKSEHYDICCNEVLRDYEKYCITQKKDPRSYPL